MGLVRKPQEKLGTQLANSLVLATRKISLYLLGLLLVFARVH